MSSKGIEEIAHEWAKSEGYWDDDLYEPDESQAAENTYLSGIRKGLELALERVRHWQKTKPGLGIVKHELEQMLRGEV